MIRKARYRKNLTQLEFSQLLGVTQSYVSKIENKKTKAISIQMILDIANILDINPVDLFINLADL